MPKVQVKYPNIEIRLTGKDGNVFSILGRCANAMKDAGIYDDKWAEFEAEATSGDYDHALAVVQQWFKAL